MQNIAKQQIWQEFARMAKQWIVASGTAVPLWLSQDWIGLVSPGTEKIWWELLPKHFFHPADAPPVQLQDLVKAKLPRKSSYVLPSMINHPFLVVDDFRAIPHSSRKVSKHWENSNSVQISLQHIFVLRDVHPSFLWAPFISGSGKATYQMPFRGIWMSVKDEQKNTCVYRACRRWNRVATPDSGPSMGKSQRTKNTWNPE